MSRLYHPSALRPLAVLLVLALAACELAPPPTVDAAAACQTPGAWIEPGTAKLQDTETLLAGLAAKRVVLLGESHDNADHHAWQAQMLAALHGRRHDVVAAFEMFPRRAQPTLDRWMAGELSAPAFLKESKWGEVWGFGADMYMPLFQFARLNAVPMVAANVDRALIRRVGKDGWANVPKDQRLGVGTPATATADYQKSLAQVFRAKLEAGTKRAHGKDKADDPGDKADTADKEIPLADVLSDPGFKRFVAAQQTWDRAMAEAIFEAAKRHPDALIVGIVGRGHAEFGHGIPHQLKDLGIKDVAVALPVSTAFCPHLPTGIADAAFVIAEQPTKARAHAPAKPKLGVYIEAAPGGIRVSKVAPGSIAEQSGIKVEDIIVKAAGEAVAKPGDLVGIIQRHAPGTWLPLDVLRGTKQHDIIAKFPPAHAPGK
ncbi:MAG: PDZ domain-containing protein [Rhodospirillaceae bacterium]|nr:PDZ domain-containing protein [Rhodospirillaceae bacterium]